MTDLSVWSEEQTTRSHRRRRKKKGGRGKAALAVVIALLLVAGILGGGAVLALGGLNKLKSAFGSSSAPDYPGPGEGQVVIEVKSGQTAADVAKTLKAQDVVKSTQAFVEAAFANPDASKLQPGFYQLAAQDGRDRRPRRRAGPRGADPGPGHPARGPPAGRDPARRLAKDTKIPLKQYEQALKKQNAEKLGLPTYAAATPRASSSRPPTTSSPTPMPTRCWSSCSPHSASRPRSPASSAPSATPEEIVTIASLVEAEARKPEDFGKVARVVYNRLEEGMPLQFDSTVNYALKADKEIVTYEDLGADSPYNTYKNTGLPPAPINSPGLCATATCARRTSASAPAMSTRRRRATPVRVCVPIR